MFVSAHLASVGSANGMDDENDSCSHWWKDGQLHSVTQWQGTSVRQGDRTKVRSDYQRKGNLMYRRYESMCAHRIGYKFWPGVQQPKR